MEEQRRKEEKKAIEEKEQSRKPAPFFDMKRVQELQDIQMNLVNASHSQLRCLVCGELHVDINCTNDMCEVHCKTMGTMECAWHGYMNDGSNQDISKHEPVRQPMVPSTIEQDQELLLQLQHQTLKKLNESQYNSNSDNGNLEFESEIAMGIVLKHLRGHWGPPSVGSTRFEMEQVLSDEAMSICIGTSDSLGDALVTGGAVQQDDTDIGQELLENALMALHTENVIYEQMNDEAQPQYYQSSEKGKREEEREEQSILQARSLEELLDYCVCKNCYVRIADYCTIPCGHVLYCSNCFHSGETTTSHCTDCRTLVAFGITIKRRLEM